jgi:heptosyltransferase-2
VLLTDRVAARRKTPEQERHDRGVRVAIALLRRQELIEGGELVRMVVEEGRLFPRVFAEYRMEATGHVVRTNALHRRGREYRALREDYQPVPAIEYYLELARHLGAENPSRAMELEVTEAERREAERALAELGFAPAIENRQSKIENIVVLVPGANFGASKCWMPERFAAVAEALADPAGPFGARVVLAGSAGETPICQAIQGAMKGQRQRVAILGSVNGGKGVSVGALKAIIRRARLMVGNDTGPRHMAAALGVPAVTLFGPTNPVWAETFSAAERVVRVEVPCGPCQLKVCPIDHRCMRGVTVERVLEAVRGVWQ